MNLELTFKCHAGCQKDKHVRNPSIVPLARAQKSFAASTPTRSLDGALIQRHAQRSFEHHAAAEHVEE